jgi:hypothetical protein
MSRTVTLLARNLRPGDVVTLTGPQYDSGKTATYRATVTGKPTKIAPGYFSGQTRYSVPLGPCPWWWGSRQLTVYSDTRLTAERG